jgi:26S proteasome regulatory subunit N2
VLLFSAKCIDYYTQQRIAGPENAKDAKEIDPRLEAIVNRKFQRCLDDGQYRQALGLALETHRMDIFEKAIVESVSSCTIINIYKTSVKISRSIQFNLFHLQQIQITG